MQQANLHLSLANCDDERECEDTEILSGDAEEHSRRENGHQHLSAPTAALPRVDSQLASKCHAAESSCYDTAVEVIGDSEDGTHPQNQLQEKAESGCRRWRGRKQATSLG